ncbi:MAG: tRNA uridine-5-carboxymethylaminomethyl(34) synthesis GTPase MnmE [Candidatus Omnitrophota bacterium]|nr:tRNA uridine-5-carboxymethylaminomethyl(34) synthesis GTPase MnmE [Candidatus Omnitrophota bacterium]
MKTGRVNDTIAAIATSIGEAGIGIVRLSGRDALKIADKVFVSKDGKKPSSFKTYTVHYGWIINKFLNSQVPKFVSSNQRTKEPANQRTNIIDEVILTVMRAPRSYTKEDVVEINCHGGIIATRAVLDLLLDSGARLAEPGEFTKRAFLNGRIDLSQAEAVLDVIRAKTDCALRVGLRQLGGGLSRRINKLRGVLLNALCVLEANIDFPEEEITLADRQEIYKKLGGINSEIKSLIDSSKYAQMLREGVQVIICGRPNVGKSSLLNALLKQERSIVTPLPGTTRDTVEEIIDIKGIPVRIVDTAGIIAPRDLIEKKAVERSKRYISFADLVILLFDSSQALCRQDEFLINKLKKKMVIAVINKIDLKDKKIEREMILQRFSKVVDISAKKSRNINLLEDAIYDCLYKGRAPIDEAAAGNPRHIAALKQAQKLIAETLHSLDNKLPPEFIAQGIKDSLLQLDIILGKDLSEDLLDKIFGDFCIGK